MNSRLSSLSLLFFAPFFSHAQIDLHAHLSLKPGTGYFIKGNFNEPPMAKEWNSRHATKATAQSLEQLHLPLIVASLYAHPQLAYTEVTGASLFSPKTIAAKSIEIEYQEILSFVNTHSDRYGIAKNANEARTLIAQQKTALVLSLEGAYGALETENDFKKWIDDRGVSIVTPFHLTEDHFSGVALLLGSRMVNSPLEFFHSLLLSGFSCLKTFCKGTMGVKPEGETLLKKLITRKVWIDTSHSNEVSLREYLPLLAQAKQPLLVTHTQIRDYYPCERGLDSLETDYLKAHDGIIGLIPTDELIEKWAKIPSNLTKCASGLDHSGIDTFKQIMTETIKKFGAEKIALGSDINAPLIGLSPACTTDANDSALKNGYYTYSQWPELIRSITPNGMSTEEWNKKNLEHFLKLWAKVK